MAGETSVERLSWSSAWMARVEGWWVEEKEEEEEDRGGSEWETAFMPVEVAEGAMLAVVEIGC